MPTRVNSIFSNPEEKPLGEVLLTVEDEDGVTRKIPAIHKHWIARQIFDNPLPLIWSAARLSKDVQLDEWMFCAQKLSEDLEFLLQCEQHEFWSHMIYEKSAHSAIVLFLQRAVPFYINVRDELSASNADIIVLYEKLLSLVLRIVCRLVTHKESKDSWLAKDHLRDLVYNNYLISVPMLFDLLIAVGDTDPQHVTILKRLFDSVLRLEPKYKQDLMAALSFFPAAFRSIQTQAENEGCEGAAGGGFDDDKSETPYDDVALYALDCAHTLAVLLEVCPTAIELCHEIKIGQSIAKFYDNTIPCLYKNICLIKESAMCLTWLNQARLQYLRTFRSLSNSYIADILSHPENGLVAAEGFIALLTECLSEQTFVVDYARFYPPDLDVDLLRQAVSDLDEFKAKYVVEGYLRESSAFVNGTFGNVALNSIPVETAAKNKPPAAQADTVAVKQNGLEKSKVFGPEPKARDFDLETTAVLEVLPHLGDGFVRRVLLRYNNSEDAIAAILEENLPPDLAQRDQTELYIPPDPRDKLFRATGIMHSNIHDGDAYDIMSNDKPDCIIKQGKGMPNTAKDAAELLDDKTELQQIRHKYQEYSLVAEDSDNDKEYNDEYDDSYEAILETENRLPKSKSIINDELSSSDETAEEDNSDKKPLDFCENPEVVRARYEARRQAKWGNRQQQQSQQSGNATSERSVVGAPKGQGQDKETLRNRQKKEAHKSTRANHNRKAGASYKRSKGMIS